jgi:hypothetical protein
LPQDGIAPQLSPREKTILRCLVDGDSSKSIAQKFHIADGTVKGHVKAILRKIRVDIGAARIVLERAVEMGSAQAGFLLVETYDPLILANGELIGRAAMRSKRKTFMRGPTPQESRRRKRGSRRCVGSTNIPGPAKSLTRFWRRWTNGLVGLRRRFLLSALAPLLLIIPPSAADAQSREPLQMPQVRMNAWTVGIAGGLLEGAPIRLAAEKVSFDTQAIAAAYSGPLIFSRFGLEVEKTFIPHQVALEQMRKGEMAAVVSITSKPLEAFYAAAGTGVRVPAVPMRAGDYYLPPASTRPTIPTDQTGRMRDVAAALVMERKTARCTSARSLLVAGC